MKHGERDAEKARYWHKAIGDAVRSGMSIREFCRRRELLVATRDEGPSGEGDAAQAGSARRRGEICPGE